MTHLLPARRLILAAAAALALAPFTAAASDDPPAKGGTPPEAKPLTADELRRLVKEAVTEGVKEEMTRVDNLLRAHATAIQKLQQDMEAARDRLDKLECSKRSADPARDEAVDGLKRQIAALQDKIDGLGRDMASVRQSGSNVGIATPGVVAPATPAPAQQAGRLRVTNTYLTPMVVQVNGTAFSIPADGLARDITVPVGNFTYQVVGVHAAPLARVMTAGGVLPVDIFPRTQ
jgi:Skp family chaperone for outer membrane proteins